jgi:hypothetical protein
MKDLIRITKQQLLSLKLDERCVSATSFSPTGMKQARSVSRYAKQVLSLHKHMEKVSRAKLYSVI